MSTHGLDPYQSAPDGLCHSLRPAFVPLPSWLILMWTDWTWLEPVASLDGPPAPGSCSQSGDKNHAVPSRKIPEGSPAAPPPRNVPSSRRTWSCADRSLSIVIIILWKSLLLDMQNIQPAVVDSNTALGADASLSAKHRLCRSSGTGKLSCNLHNWCDSWKNL